MTSLFRKFTWWMRRRRKEDELREELQFHLSEEAEERHADWLPEDQARWAARRDLGNVTLLREDTRALWTWTPLEQLAQDLRYAVRMMFRNRAFTALAALSLALGIGANTAIYSFMDAILLRSLPVADPASLVVLNWRSKDPRGAGTGQEKPGKDGRVTPSQQLDPRGPGKDKAKPGREWHAFVMHGMSGHGYNDAKTGLTSGIFPFPAFELFRKGSDAVFSSVFAYYPAEKLNVIVKGQADLASGEYISGDYFRGLAVSPAAGRLIVSDDDRVGATPVAV